jgi:steroid delta-isomerase-like uncharacterized protein
MSVVADMIEYQRAWTDAVNRGDVSAADRSFAPDVVVHITGLAEPVRGVDAWKQLMAGFLTAFPDAHFTMEDSVVDGDRVAHRWHVRGTHTGPLGAAPPTGRPVEIDGLILDRVADGKAVERWEQYDQPRLLQQLGLA